MSTPPSVIALIGLLFFLALGGFYGGLLMVIDPAGVLLYLPEKTLEQIGIVKDFSVPGYFLILFFGLFPLTTAVGLIIGRHWGLMIRLNPFRHYHWAWTASLECGLLLLIWMWLQFSLIGYQHPVQAVTLALAVGIIALALTPGVRKFYRA